MKSFFRVLMLVTLLFGALSLYSYNPEWKRNLKGMFNSSQWYERNGGYMKIAETEDSQWLPMVIEALKNESSFKTSESERRTIFSNASEAMAKMGREVIPNLIHYLKEENNDIAMPIIQALGKLKARRAIPYILPYVQSGSVNSRRIAVIALGEIGTQKVFAALNKALSDRSKWVKMVAIEAVADAGDTNAVPKLNKLLRDRDKDIREKTAQAIGQLKDNRAVDALVRALRDKEEVVAYYALYSLGNIGGRKASRAILKTLQRKKDYRIKAAVISLAKIGSPDIVPGLLRAERNFRALGEYKEYVKALCSFKDKRVVRLIKKYFNHARLEAAEALVKIQGKKAVSYLWKKYRSARHIYDKMHIARAIAMTGDQNAIQVFVDALERDDVMEANWIRSHLADLGGRVVPLIINFINKYKNDFKRYNAVKALSKISSPSAIPVLIREADAENINIQLAAIRGLGNQKNSEEVEAVLGKLMGYQHPSIREEALKSLVKIQGAEMMHYLDKARKDSHHKVRKTAYEQIRILRDMVEKEMKEKSED